MTSTQEVCVAAIDLQRLRIVRPLQWNHRNWPRTLTASGLNPGCILQGQIRAVQNSHGFPHETEDMQLSGNFDILEQIPEQVLFSNLASASDRSIAEIFSGQVQEAKYIIDGTNCRSLGGILVTASTTSIEVDDFDKTRISFKDSSGQEYVLPVTDLRVANDQSGDHAYIRGRIRESGNSQIHLRIGLARGFDRNGQWNPKRCYLQVNGIIFPK